MRIIWHLTKLWDPQGIWMGVDWGWEKDNNILNPNHSCFPFIGNGLPEMTKLYLQMNLVVFFILSF